MTERIPTVERRKDSTAKKNARRVFVLTGLVASMMHSKVEAGGFGDFLKEAARAGAETGQEIQREKREQKKEEQRFNLREKQRSKRLEEIHEHTKSILRTLPFNDLSYLSQVINSQIDEINAEYIEKNRAIIARDPIEAGAKEEKEPIEDERKKAVRARWLVIQEIKELTAQKKLLMANEDLPADQTMSETAEKAKFKLEELFGQEDQIRWEANDDRKAFEEWRLDHEQRKTDALEEGIGDIIERGVNKLDQ